VTDAHSISSTKALSLVIAPAAVTTIGGRISGRCSGCRF
jgi:hypothetical protein